MIQRPSSTPVFILAGGSRERLAPLTEARPKPAVAFGGTHQIIDFTLSNCVNSGLRKIYVLTQDRREHLHDYIRETRGRMSPRFRWNDGDELTTLAPLSGKRYRGTADAVFQNLPLIRLDSAENLLIAAGDHIYSMDSRQTCSSILSGHGLAMASLCGARLTTEEGKWLTDFPKSCDWKEPDPAFCSFLMGHTSIAGARIERGSWSHREEWSS